MEKERIIEIVDKINRTRISSGQGNNKDLKFKTCTFDQEIFKGYDAIIALTYNIEQKDLEEINDSDLIPRDESHGDYDCGSGNIHPAKNRIPKDGKIWQLVLASTKNTPTGPKGILINGEKSVDDKLLPNTPRANYYPLINKDYGKNLSEYEEEKQVFLSTIFDQLENTIMKINNYNDVEKLAEILKEKDVVIDLEDCKDRIRVLDFISGITFYNGSIEKLTKDTFKVSLKR